MLQRLFADGVLPFRHFMFRMFENPQLRLFYGGMQNLFPPCVLGSPRFVADDDLLWRRFLLVGGDRRRRFVGVEDLLHARRFHEVLAVVLERHLLSHLARFLNAFFMKALMKPLVCFRPGNLIIRHDRMFGEAGVNVAPPCCSIVVPSFVAIRTPNEQLKQVLRLYIPMYVVSFT